MRQSRWSEADAVDEARPDGRAGEDDGRDTQVVEYPDDVRESIIRGMRDPSTWVRRTDRAV